MTITTDGDMYSYAVLKAAFPYQSFLRLIPYWELHGVDRADILQGTASRKVYAIYTEVGYDADH